MHSKRWLTAWFMAAIAAMVVVTLLFFAHVYLDNHVLSNYLEDIAGAITVILLSVATYEEWERRHQLVRSKASREMGIRRVKDEVFQLLYEYAFVLNLRLNPDYEAKKAVNSLVFNNDFSRSTNDLHANTAKQISQEDVNIRSKLFEASRQALLDLRLANQTYGDMDELITQAERTLDKIDMALAIYASSFTPEVLEWALSIREKLSQCIVGKPPLLSIHLSSISGSVNNRLSSADCEGISVLVSELIEVGTKTDKLHKI